MSLTPEQRDRVTRWAAAYRRLMLGGLGEKAHTAGVDAFANENGDYPYITADDIDALLAEREAGAAEVRARVAELGEEWSLTAFPDQATADLMRLDLARLLAALTTEDPS